MSNYKRAFLLILVVIAGIADVLADDRRQILIVAHANDAVYSQVVAGFKAELSTSADYKEMIQTSDAAFVEEIKQRKPDLVFALGAAVSALTQQKSGNVPVIGTLVQKTQILQSANSTGVSLNFPFPVQIQWLKKVLPQQHKVGVLYNAMENEKAVQLLKKSIEQAGLEMVGMAVQSSLQLPDILVQLENKADVLMIVPDNVVLSSSTIQDVMLAAFRDRVPLVGLSDNWVKSGALYALTWDYQDLGRQCAIQAKKLLNGQAIKDVPVETPRKIAYSINTKVASDLDIAIPEEILQKASERFN